MSGKVLIQILVGMLQFAVEYVEDFRRTIPETVTLYDSYDFIIVGAGSAGCVLANRLTENPEWNVLLIEAGYDSDILMDIPLLAPLLQLTSANWNFTSEPSNSYCLAMTNHQCRLPRGKIVGGSSILNYMIFTRGNPQDYNHWAQLGNPEWSYDKVLPYFKKLETFTPGTPTKPTKPRKSTKPTTKNRKYLKEYHGTTGPLSITYPKTHTELSKAIIQANLDFGLPLVDYNAKSQIGVSHLQVNQKNGFRHSLSDAYLQPIRTRKNLHLLKNTLVHKIIFTKESDKLQTKGVLIERSPWKKGTLSDLTMISCTKEVILSAGAISSPQILMLSGIGPKNDLKTLKIPVLKDLPVGKNLMDHIATGLTFRFNQSLPYSIKITQALMAIPKYLDSHQGVLNIPGGCELITFYDTTRPGNLTSWPDMELLYISGQLTMGQFLTDIFGLKPQHLKDYKPSNTEGFTIFPMLLRPKSRGFVKLKDTEITTPPIIVPNYLSHPDDVRVMIKGIKLAFEIMSQEPMRKLGVRFHRVLRKECPWKMDTEKGRDKYFECLIRYYTLTIYHQSGTCGMGVEGDKQSVVSERLKVHGVQGLRVVDASVMPEIIAGHTNGPVVMIAERASDLIKEDYFYKNLK